MIKKKIILLLAIIILLIASTVTAFALYIASFDKATIDFNVTEKGVTDISTERELILATTDILNRTDKSTHRLLIKNNIILTKNLNITREVVITYDVIDEATGAKAKIIENEKCKISDDTVRSYLNDNVKDFYIDKFDYIFKYRHHDISWEIVVNPAVTNGYTVTATYGMDALTKEPFKFVKDIVIVAKDQAAEILAKGKAEIDNFLLPYLYESTYFLHKNLSLPIGNTYLGLTYSYALTANKVVVELGTGGQSNYLKILEEGTFTLNVTIGFVVNADIKLEPSYKFSVVTSTNDQVVNSVMDKHFKWLFFYEKGEKGKKVLPKTNAFVDKGIISVKYSIIGDNKTETETDKFNVKLNTETDKYEVTMLEFPSANDQIHLKIEFGFLGDVIVTRQSKLYSTDAGVGDGGAGALDAYLYNTLNTLLSERSGGRTYTSFEMPQEMLGNKITYTLSNNDLEIVKISPVGTETTDFEINRAKIPHNDVRIEVKYTFVDEVYTKSSFFTIIGLVQATEFEDANFYNKILEFYDTTSTILGVTTPTTDEGVLTYREAIAVNTEVFTINLSNTAPMTLTSLRGIELLQGTSKINLNNTGISTGVSYLAQLKLKELSMKGNNLDENFLTKELQKHMFNYIEVLDLSDNKGLFSSTDFTSIPRYNTLTKLVLSNSGLKDLSKVGDFVKLNILDISNNTVPDIRPLLSCEKLKEVYLYNNGAKAIKDYFITTYVLLTNRKVAVYAVDASTLFVTSVNLDEAAGVLEAIAIYKLSFTEIILPYEIANPKVGTYSITWTYYDDEKSIAISGVHLNGGLMTVKHSRTTSFSLLASVTVGDKTLYRRFEVII